ncbi:MAG: ferredoxin [Thermoplasmata archaeon]|nr:MAG: ferredoxin [Thermoplasmata archaeon]HEC89850.1 ferredoxin [Thermoplasmatales archaeon]
MVKHKAKVDERECLSCGGCISVCPVDAVFMKNLRAFVDQSLCIGCSICVNTCPIGAISLEE